MDGVLYLPSTEKLVLIIGKVITLGLKNIGNF